MGMLTFMSRGTEIGGSKDNEVVFCCVNLQSDPQAADWPVRLCVQCNVSCSSAGVSAGHASSVFPRGFNTHTHTFIHAAAAVASLQGEQRPTSTNAPENLHLLSYIDYEYMKVTVNIWRCTDWPLKRWISAVSCEETWIKIFLPPIRSQ